MNDQPPAPCRVCRSRPVGIWRPLCDACWQRVPEDLRAEWVAAFREHRRGRLGDDELAGVWGRCLNAIGGRA